MTEAEISILLARLAEGRLLPNEAAALRTVLSQEAPLADALRR